MEAKDLMTGDYLRVAKDNLCIKKNTIVEIRGVDADDKLAEKGLIGSTHCRPLDDDQFEGGIWCEYLEPIPLTPEILEKNGFVNKKGRFMQKGNFDVPPLILWHLVDDEILKHPKSQLEIHYGGKSIHVSLVCIYVHELQHALKLCEIDKEIQL